MTLHSQTPFNFHNEDLGRDFVMPVKPVVRWTARETRALEDWWIANMPRAGRVRPSSGREEKSASFMKYRGALIIALQDWVSRDQLVALADERHDSVTAFLRAHRQKGRIETKEHGNRLFFRFNQLGKDYGCRITDPAAVFLPALEKWVEGVELAKTLSVDPSYVTFELAQLVKAGLVKRERISNRSYFYIRTTQ